MSITRAYRGGFAGRPGWHVAFTYDEALVARLKAAIPHTQRSWNEDTKEWWIADEQAERVLDVLPGFEAFLHQPSLF